MQIPNPLKRFNWLRHSRGFGVHSPWAYTLITGVLREKAHYYAYGQIDKLFGRGRKTARTVYRILLYVHPAAIHVAGDSRWLTLARVATVSGGKGSVYLVSDPAKYDSATAQSAETLIFTCLDTTSGRRIWNALQANPDETGSAVDTHRRIGVLCRRRGLPRQTIHMRTILP